jgi:hypothetical protein
MKRREFIAILGEGSACLTDVSTASFLPNGVPSTARECHGSHDRLAVPTRSIDVQTYPDCNRRL